MLQLTHHSIVSICTYAAMDWSDKVCLITGAAAGIGKATAEELCSLGARVVVTDVDEPSGELLCKQLNNKYGRDRTIFCECDVTDYTQFEEAFQTAFDAFGRLDAVINNAAVLNDRLWELQVDVNLNGVIRGTLLGLQHMGKDRGGRGGIIVNIGSNCSVKPYPSLPIYSATKQAVLGLTRAYGDAFHVSSTGVRVICVCPGATDSNLIQDIRKQLLSSDYEKAWKRDTASSSPQKCEHVAKCIIDLAGKAQSGSAWLVANGQAPKVIPPS